MIEAPILWTLALSGCLPLPRVGDEEFDAGPTESAPPGYDGATTVDTASAVADSGSPTPLATPAYWSLSGTVTLTDTGPDVSLTFLQAQYWGSAPKLEELCLVDIPVVSVYEPSEDAGSEFYAWSGYEVGPPPKDAEDSPECPAWTTGPLEIGFGQYDGSLDPALDAQGKLKSSVYGLYLRVGAQVEPFLVGVAGTEAMFENTEVAAPEAPVPSGQYRLEGLILLDL